MYFLVGNPEKYQGLANQGIVEIKVIQIVSRKALIECSLLHENIQKETDTETENSIYYDFMRFGGIIYITQPPEAENSLH